MLYTENKRRFIGESQKTKTKHYVFNTCFQPHFRFGKDVPRVGFYGFGEVSKVAIASGSWIHFLKEHNDAFSSDTTKRQTRRATTIVLLSYYTVFRWLWRTRWWAENSKLFRKIRARRFAAENDLMRTALGWNLLVFWNPKWKIRNPKLKRSLYAAFSNFKRPTSKPNRN